MSFAPWWLKIGGKVVLSRLPLGYWFWQRIGLFRHGQMDNDRYLSTVFDSHVEKAGLTGNLRNKTILELGPGDSVGAALLAASYGAKLILVDSGSFAVSKVEVYKKLADRIKSENRPVPDISNATTIEEILRLCGARYLTSGLTSLSSIEDNSVDLVFSQAVLEHVRKHEFFETMCHCHRILVPDGVASHRIDFKDHLGGGLDNLRFSERMWESKFFVQSGFYTNRIRYSEMLKIMRNAGFEIDVLRTESWNKLPLDRRKLDSGFANLPDAELALYGADLLLRPLPNGSG